MAMSETESEREIRSDYEEGETATNVALLAKLPLHVLFTRQLPNVSQRPLYVFESLEEIKCKAPWYSQFGIVCSMEFLNRLF